ncbi:MAG: KH domain-containing protein [archaeon]|nr:KH domain-containing protein [archaeon]
MRQTLPRVPKDRIAVLIGSKGATVKALRDAAGCQRIEVDSDSGDVEVVWGESGTYDPIRAMKLPDVIKAIGRGITPNSALRLLDDNHFFEMVDLRDFVGKRSNQQRRIRARIIGREGKIRTRIEQLTNTEISIYNSTVVIIGEEEGLYSARQAIEMLAGGSEHGSVIHFLEKDRRRARLQGRALEMIEEKEGTYVGSSQRFEDLVPGLDLAAERRNRRMKASQVDPSNPDEVEEVMELAEDESIVWEEE